MLASSLLRTNSARVCGCTALAVGIVLVVGFGCGKTPTRDTTTTTTAPATTTTTTVPASTTTTTVPGTTTTSTTTTSIAVLDARIDLQNTPCIAPGSGQVSCTFTGSATTGGRTPYTFRWRFTNPANNQVVDVNGQNARPELGCGFATGVVTFSLRAALTVTDSSGATNTDTRDVQITRAAGACGT